MPGELVATNIINCTKFTKLEDVTISNGCTADDKCLYGGCRATSLERERERAGGGGGGGGEERQIIRGKIIHHCNLWQNMDKKY